jgi:very-short-patch-repair endonuclease
MAGYIMNKEQLRELISVSPRGYSRTLVAKHGHMLSMLKDRYGDLNIGQLCFNWINDLNDSPKCTCGVELKFKNVNIGYAKICRQCYFYDLKVNSSKHKERLKGASTCNYEGCEALVSFDEIHGTWNKFCSYSCSGKHNSLTTRDKAKATLKKNYGVEHAMQCNVIVERSRATSLERFGNQNHTYMVNGISEATVAVLSDVEYMAQKYAEEGTKGISEALGVSISCAERRLRKLDINLMGGKSLFEKEVAAYIKSIYAGQVIVNTRKIINGKELDIYLPDLKFAIECDGAYWHGELQGKDKNYHLDKTEACDALGIRLIHIWDFEWNKERDKYKLLLSRAMGNVTNKIHARKCTITTPSTEDSEKFFIDNFAHSWRTPAFSYGLEYEGELIQVISFINSELPNNYELVSMCTNKDVVVVGGVRMLFDMFVLENSPTTVVSYSDRSVSAGEIYAKIGFEFVHHSKPNYRYTKNYTTVENSSEYQKDTLSEKLEIFEPSMSEWENMKMNGYDRLWDCGNSLWAWHNK